MQLDDYLLAAPVGQGYFGVEVIPADDKIKRSLFRQFVIFVQSMVRHLLFKDSGQKVPRCSIVFHHVLED